LGAAIVDIGELDEDALIEVLCDQLHLSRANAPNPYGTSLSLFRRLPEHHAKALSVFPLEEKDDGKVVLACAVVPDRQSILELEAALGVPVEFRLARRAEVALALRHGYARLKPTGPREIVVSRTGPGLVEYRPLGELLIDMGAITYPDLVKAVSEAARSGRRLGEYLVGESLIEQEQMVKAMAQQRMGEHQAANLMASGNPTVRDQDPVSWGVSTSR
jgi:hypothetical protein